jgi:hypothetical protein
LTGRAPPPCEHANLLDTAKLHSMPLQPPIWKRPNPRRRTGTSKPLTEAQKAAARRRAQAAGRPWPNLIDNIWAARQKP